MEIGNEDFFDRSGSYDAYRFPMFYDAIKAAYPQLKIIATTPVTTRTPDVIDEHYYNNDPDGLHRDGPPYDGYQPHRTQGPRRRVRDHQRQGANPTGTLAARARRGRAS